METLQDAGARINDLKGAQFALTVFIRALVKVLPRDGTIALAAQLSLDTEAAMAHLLHQKVGADVVTGFERELHALSTSLPAL